MPSQQTQTIANQIREEVGEEKINQLNCELELVVELFLAFSRPLRRKIRAFFRTQRAMLNTELQRISSQALKANTLAQVVSVIEAQFAKVTSPVENFLATVPLEDVMRSPSFSCVFGRVFDNVPVSIPPAMASALEQYVGEDFFDGITSFADLKRRINLFLWRARKTVAATTYAERAERQARKLLDNIDVYLDIIETIDAETIVGSGD